MKKKVALFSVLLALLLAACGQGGADAPAADATGGQDSPQITVYKSPA